MNFIRVRFSDSDTETEALGFLAGRLSFRSWENGETLVPETARAVEGIPYVVLGPPTYAHSIPALRNSAAKDGSPVPQKVLGQTPRELRKQFGAVSAETQQIEGQWEHRGKLHRDLNARVFVDVADNAESRQFFIDHEEQLKARFQQIDIWLTTYLIKVI